MTTPKTVYQLKVTLNGPRAPIWRRLLVPENVTLAQLHTILQIAMGWTDSHLHQFLINGQYYGDPQYDEYGELELLDETHFRLKQFVLREKFSFRYEYDFGDGWLHTILVEKILPAEKGQRTPLCLAGKRACPPEDVGGIGGYDQFLQAIADPNHEEHDEYLRWIGEAFDPQRFDLQDVNERLPYYKSGVVGEPEIASDPGVDARFMQKALDWASGLPREQYEQLDALPVRRDMLTFLNYLHENRTVGTQSTGNLPLKSVRAVCERFVDPPELDTAIGKYVHKLRSESEVWPLYYIHVLAEFGGLLAGGAGRIWQVTPAGEKYAELPASIQVAFLCSTWWQRVDWRVAYDFSGFSRGIPEGFNAASLACLLELPAGQACSYESFADRVITKSGLIWPIENQENARDILHWSIVSMVVKPLAGFGVLDCGYSVKNSGGYEFSELNTICLTPTGKGLLQTL